MSILLNVILGGSSNQTFSARNYYWKQNGYPHLVWLIDFIIFWDRDHCLHSWIYFKTTRDLRRIHVMKTEKTGMPKHIYHDSGWIDLHNTKE